MHWNLFIRHFEQTIIIINNPTDELLSVSRRPQSVSRNANYPITLLIIIYPRFLLSTVSKSCESGSETPMIKLSHFHCTSTAVQ